MNKKKLPRIRQRLPKFRSDEEAAEYFETHAVTNVWNQLPKATPAKASQKLAKSIQEQHRQARSPISLWLGADQTAAAKKIPAAKSVGYQTQLRMWIAEGIGARRNGLKRSQIDTGQG